MYIYFVSQSVVIIFWRCTSIKTVLKYSLGVGECQNVKSFLSAYGRVWNSTFEVTARRGIFRLIGKFFLLYRSLRIEICSKCPSNCFHRLQPPPLAVQPPYVYHRPGNLYFMYSTRMVLLTVKCISEGHGSCKSFYIVLKYTTFISN